MPYTNTIVTTSTSGTWNGTSLSYSTISLIDGIPHSAQLEVERVFTVPRSTGTYATIEDFLNNSATTQKDKQQVFIIPASRITFNETSKTITAIDLPSTGNTYDYDPDGVGLANVPVPAIAVGDTLKVRRKTVSNQSLVEWTAGSKLTSSQLNLEVKQLLYLIQELVDKTTTEVTLSNTAIGTIPNYSIVPTKLSAGSPIWNSSSFVGIGMTPTTRTLSVYQAAYPTIQIVNSTTGSLAGDGGIIYMSGNDMLITNQESANLKLETNNTTRLTISSSGDVGIGTTTPVARLQVAGNSPQYSPQIGTRQPGNQYEFGHSNVAGYGSVIGAEIGSGAPFIAFNCGAGTNNNTYKTFGLAGAVLKSDNAGGLNISTIANANADNQSAPTDPTIAFTPTSTVVIGSSTKVNNPSFSNGLKLEIITASTDGAVGLYHYGDIDVGNSIRFFRAKGSKASPTGLVSGNVLGSIRGLGYNGSAFTYATGTIDIITTENWSTTANGTAIVFNTTPNGSAAASLTERMRITSAGEVLIAGTTDQGPYNLQCNGTGVWGAGAYVNGSDSRIKHDINPIGSCLDLVAAIEPVTFVYNADWSSDQTLQTGFIAQQLQTALAGQPYLDGIVSQGGEYLNVAYQNIIPLLTKSIQELKAIVEAQAARITELEARA